MTVAVDHTANPTKTRIVKTKITVLSHWGTPFIEKWSGKYAPAPTEKRWLMNPSTATNRRGSSLLATVEF